MNLKTDAFIIDIDGTVADHTDIRGHHEYHLVSLDKPRPNIIRLVRMVLEGNLFPIFVSGRPSTCADDTKQWLHEHVFAALGPWRWIENSHYDLIMRDPEIDGYKKDYIVKERLYREHIEPHYNVIFVLDDRTQVVNMWRSLGLDCLQVAPGDF